MAPGGFLPLWIEAPSALIVLAILSFIQFRHLGLAAMAALAPLPGAAAVAVFGIAPEPISYLFGYFTAAILASGIEMRVCDGAVARNAVRETMKTAWPLLVWPVVLAIALSGVVAAVAGDLAVPMNAGAIGACCFSSVVLAFFFGRIMPYGEDFITRANRARERRERWLDALAFVIQPRWGWSVSGIGLVFATLGFFHGGSGGASWTTSALIAFAAMEAVFATAALVATRSLRRAVAFALAAAILICLASWIGAEWRAASAAALALATSPTLIMAMQSARFAREGDKAAVAALRSSERHAVMILFFSIAAAMVLCLFGQLGAAILVVGSALPALLAFPALVTAIYDLFPPRVSLDAYRVR